MTNKITGMNTLTMAAGVLVALSVSLPSVADVKDPNPAKDKYRLLIICTGDMPKGKEKSEDVVDWKCEVRDKNNKLVQGSEKRPDGATDERALVVVATAPPENHKDDIAADGKTKILNQNGPHCWIQIAGKWTMIHC